MPGNAILLGNFRTDDSYRERGILGQQVNAVDSVHRPAAVPAVSLRYSDQKSSMSQIA